METWLRTRDILLLIHVKKLPSRLMRRISRPCPVAHKHPSWLRTPGRLEVSTSMPLIPVTVTAGLVRRGASAITRRWDRKEQSSFHRRYTTSSTRLQPVVQPVSNPTLTSAEPTIYALSTAPGRAAIAVIRISGPACTTIYQTLCPNKPPLQPRIAAVRALYQPGSLPSPDSILDPSALLLYFAAPKTVTGEDVLELHVHGGVAVVKAVLAAIPKCAPTLPGTIRYAEPGEFTRRAFMNDRLDLTQVEALGDTLSANTEQQRRLSVRGTTNTLAKRYEDWRLLLLHARGELEALIDFSEDQHFDESPRELTNSVAGQVQRLLVHLRTHSQNAVRGELLRNGISISLLGAPNAGKSSLLNSIVGRDAAIVSQEAGTTRDVVQVGLDLGGYLCNLGDTAGLRRVLDLSKTDGQHMAEKIGAIEQEGMRRAKALAMESDVVVVVLSLERDAQGQVNLALDPEVVETAALLAEKRGNVLVVVNKSDLLASTTPSPFSMTTARSALTTALPSLDPSQLFFISCLEAQSDMEKRGNIPPFLTALIAKFQALTSPLVADGADSDSDSESGIWHESLGASERHRVLLEECASHLENFLVDVGAAEGEGEGEAAQDEEDIDIVLAAEHLRSAGDCLGRITGKGLVGDSEEVLGVVFAKFCVGK